MSKKKIILAASALTGTALVGGAFALFFSQASDTVEQKVGTVNIDGSASLKNYELNADFKAKAELAYDRNHTKLTVDDIVGNINEVETGNLNPADNEPGNIGDNAQNDEVDPYCVDSGTDHELNITIENEGTKSVSTRVLVDVTGTGADGQPLTEDELKAIKLYFDNENTISGLTGIASNEYQLVKNFGADGIGTALQAVTPSDENTITYIFDKDTIANAVFAEEPVDSYRTAFDSIIESGLVLSGTGDSKNVETEKYSLNGEVKTCPTSGSFKIDVVVDDEAPASIAGATINFNVRIQAMQFRNTSNATWETIKEFAISSK